MDSENEIEEDGQSPALLLPSDMKSRKRKLEYNSCNKTYNKCDESESKTKDGKTLTTDSDSVSICKTMTLQSKSLVKSKYALLSPSLSLPTKTTTETENIKKFNSDLRQEEERLRKLRMVKMYREKNNLEDLGELIDKWRDVFQESFQDLQDKLPPPRPSFQELLDHLQIDYNLVRFDVETGSFS